MLQEIKKIYNFGVYILGLPKHLQFLSDQSQVLKELNSDLDTNPSTNLYPSYTRHLETGLNRVQFSRSTWDQETDSSRSTWDQETDSSRSTWDQDTESSKVLNTRLDVGGRVTRDTYLRFRNQLFTPQTKHEGFKQRNNRHFNQNGERIKFFFVLKKCYF